MTAISLAQFVNAGLFRSFTLAQKLIPPGGKTQSVASLWRKRNVPIDSKC
jgi:hypothetical protein